MWFINRNPCMVTGVVSTITLTSRSTDVKLLCFSRCAHTGVPPNGAICSPQHAALSQNSQVLIPLVPHPCFPQTKIRTEFLICVWFNFSDIQHLLPSALPLTCGDKLCYSNTDPYGFHLRLACLGVISVYCGTVTKSCEHLMPSGNRLNFVFALFCSACVSTILK